MSVYNAVGEGPTSPPQEVFVGEAGMYPCTTGLVLPLLSTRSQIQKDFKGNGFVFDAD